MDRSNGTIIRSRNPNPNSSLTKTHSLPLSHSATVQSSSELLLLPHFRPANPATVAVVTSNFKQPPSQPSNFEQPQLAPSLPLHRAANVANFLPSIAQPSFERRSLHPAATVPPRQLCSTAFLSLQRRQLCSIEQPFPRRLDFLKNEVADRDVPIAFDMKRVWLSKKFSYIYASGPSTNLTFFMQSLRGWNWDTISIKFGTFMLNDLMVERVLLELKDPSDAKCALGFFHWSTKRRNIEHGIRCYCIAIHILVGARLLNDACALLESLLNKTKESSSRVMVADTLLGCYPVTDSHPIVFDLLIQAYAKLRLTDVAFEVCLYVEKHGFSISLVSFNTLLHVAQKSDQFGLIWDVYEHMIQERTYPNLATLRIMINALCKDGQLQKIVDALDRIMGKWNSSPSVIVNSSLIFRVLEQGKMEESMVVVLLKRLLQKNLIPHSVAYSLIIHARIRLGSLDSGWEMYEEMERRGFQANSFIYTSFIGAYCREGRIEQANVLMQAMEERGLKPYGETFDHLIIGYANLEQLEGCLSACDKMLSIGLIPSCLSFNTMVEKLCAKGHVEQANSRLTLLLDKGFSPSDITYTHLIEGYAKKDEIQEVLKLYYEMEYRSMSPGLSVFTSIIQCLCHCGKLEDADKYLWIMKGQPLTPSVTIYKTLIAGYRQKGYSIRALHLQNEMDSLVIHK
ncbi:hypothetical protein Ahy_A09g045135 isoform C [Arachis hypogaea]|uniref:Pentatricopeptide repeat-containing protein n=1 Tax=Arachis hypogaea TaxID=3818 RepID=A0A445BLM8_ARAHY|nr:hypothetical protein Ahy_A09g045135 isoform C [Arachis hypogaea]